LEPESGLKTFATALILLALAAQPALARGGYHQDGELLAAAQPCGVAAGGLPDPAQTRRCLADRFKAPKPKPADPHRAQSPDATNGPQPQQAG
jgi:hypothetical protein